MKTPLPPSLSPQTVVAIVGPTASGKTALSIEVAKRFNGEVISADSRQVYRGLNIGTGKITYEEMRGVPHHLIDIVDIDQVYTGYDFGQDARVAIDDIAGREHLPIIAGGTSFYLDLLRGKRQAAPVPPNETLRTSLSHLSVEELYQKLLEIAPQRAATIDSRNPRRLIRALEVAAAPNETTSSSPHITPYRMLIIGMQVDKETLRLKFADRLEEWLARGFEEEVRHLLEAGVSEEKLSEVGFEYTLMASFIRGEIDQKELSQRFVEKNWQYAKRQLTWLKKDSEVEWYAPENREAIFRRVESFLNN